MKGSAGDETPAVRGKLPNSHPAGDAPLERATRGYQLSLILPAWNEAETIQQAVQEADAALSLLAADYEIVIVDDGSTDATSTIVASAAEGNRHVRLVRHKGNRGYGAALRSGFQVATFELVAFTDADCQFNLAELERMLPLTRRHDVICGYRMDRQEGRRRRFFSWGYNILVKLLLGSALRDIDCALKIFHRDQLQAILPECDNFFVNTEMLTRARLQGLSIVEVGVRHRRRAAGKSKVSLLDIPRTLRALLPFWWAIRIRSRFSSSAHPQCPRPHSAGEPRSRGLPGNQQGL